MVVFAARVQGGLGVLSKATYDVEGDLRNLGAFQCFPQMSETPCLDPKPYTPKFHPKP